MATTYSLSAYNEKTQMNEIFLNGLSKSGAYDMARRARMMGAKNVKVIIKEIN